MLLLTSLAPRFCRTAWLPEHVGRPPGKHVFQLIDRFSRWYEGCQGMCASV